MASVFAFVDPNVMTGLWIRNEILSPGLLGDMRELLNILKFGMSNASMERFNATVSQILTRGHRYCDERYLFLKLRQ